MRHALVLLLVIGSTATAGPTADLAPRLPGGRVAVLPVLFVPRGTPLAGTEAIDAAVAQHLAIARAHYRELLGTTFAVAPGPIGVLHGEQADEQYQGTDRAERIMRELLAWRGTDRYRADVVFLMLYVSNGRLIGGGGIPFNGAPGTGGGYVEMDLASLTTDKPYPFQSTLVHELGHAFGLPHAECYGHDQMTASSMMSYNPQHWSSGTTPSATRGGFSPEDRAALALNQRVFPGLRYDPARDGVANLERVERCFIGPVSARVSPLVDVIGVGFELFYDGERVNGPDAALYARAQAIESCETSRAWYPNVRVECRYNGVPLSTSRKNAITPRM